MARLFSTSRLPCELALPAQLSAKKVYGFDESHMTVLTNAEVAHTLNALLDSVALQQG